MMSKQNVPELRFPEFSGEWESVSIQDLYEENYSGGTPKTSVKEYWNGNIPWIQSSDLTIDSLKTVNVRKHITSQAISNSATKLVPKNSIAIVTRVGVGKLAYINYDFATSQDFISLSGVKSDINFTLYILYKLLKRELSALQGTSIKGMTKKELINKSIFLPELDEQKKIGDLLNKIDRLIELEEKKLELLEEQKKGYMQKIFSQELRFKDESGNDYPEWKEKKLGDIAQIVGGGTPSTSNELYWGDDILWFTPTEIGLSKYVNNSIRMITEQGLKNSSAKLLPKGTLLLTTRATLGRMSILKQEATTNQGFQSIVLKKGYSVDFIYYNSNKIEKILKKVANGSTFLEVSKKEVAKIELTIPIKEEQNKIGKFISILDGEIDKKNERVVILKRRKKGLLQKMLV